MIASPSVLAALVGVLLLPTPGWAAWRSGNPDIEAAARDARIAGALAAVNALDEATVRGDSAGFAALLAEDLAVNNPQNGVSVRGATAQRSAAGQIAYTRHDRIIEYAGLREDMVLLMGEEIVHPRDQGASGPEVHRRFTDLWKQSNGRWKLTARQATIIERP